MSRNILILIIVFSIIIVIFSIILYILYINSSRYEYYYLKNQKSINIKKCKSIGIVGGGISGLVFSKNISKYIKTTLFEQNNKFGGNNYSSKEFIPMRFSCFLTNHSKPLKNLLKELKLKEVRIRCDSIDYKIINKIKKNNIINRFFDIISFYFFNYIPIITKLNFSKMLDNSFINKELDFNNNIIANNLIPICGINLFSNYKDFNNLPTSMIALYIEIALKSNWLNTFQTINGGNHLLIKKLINKIKSNVNLKKNSKINSVEITRDKQIMLNKKYKFDSVIISIQPHEAKYILPANLEPHQSIFKCFEKVKSYSCVHTYKNVFKNADLKSTLSYEIIGGNHYLHIDAYFYTIKSITKPRQRFITVWYDTAQNIIPKEFIIEQTSTNLSRQKQNKKKILNKLLKEIKTNHSNIHLCNSSYFGFMWHNDGVEIADTLAKSFLVNN